MSKIQEVCMCKSKYFKYVTPLFIILSGVDFFISSLVAKYTSTVFFNGYYSDIVILIIFPVIAISVYIQHSKSVYANLDNANDVILKKIFNDKIKELKIFVSGMFILFLPLMFVSLEINFKYLHDYNSESFYFMVFYLFKWLFLVNIIIPTVFIGFRLKNLD